MKRKLKWLVIVLAVSLLGFGVVLYLWPRDRITAESWQNIRVGMTEEEVAEMLGGPGRTAKEAHAEYTRLEKELGRASFEIEGVVGEREKVWIGRRGIIVIELDEDNHVRWKVFRGGRWANAGIIDRLRDWLGW